MYINHKYPRYIGYIFFLHLIANTIVIAYNLPQIFKVWHCINFVKNIDSKKPYPFQIGELPLITWYDNKYNKTYTTINVCSHMGSKLDKGKINNGCLVCPAHGMQYTEEKAFGETMIYQDKLWWSYEPNTSNPPSTPFYNNKKYSTTNICMDVDANIMDCVLNTMDVNHPKLYNINIPPKKVKRFKFQRADNNNKLGISFTQKVDVSTNKMELLNENNKYNKYYNMYSFPYNTWTRTTLPNKQQSIMNIDFVPLGIDKTRWFITIKNNCENNNILTKPFMYYYAKQYKDLLQNQASHSGLKELVIRQDVLANEYHIDDIYNMFEKYRYPDNSEVCNLYKYHKRKLNYEVVA